jgi:high-affinity iron transporter
VLPTFVIGLREGLEAALIVGIVAAFLAKTGNRRALRQVWLGVALAVVICLAFGVTLKFVSEDLPQTQQETLETVIGLIAVAMVTYMIVWMRRHSRELKGHLEDSAAGALAAGSAGALVLMAFLAVFREGFETSVFLLATFQAAGETALPALGALLGIAVATVIGFAIYRGGLKLNLAKVFKGTSALLVLIAAGLLATAAHTGHEAALITFGQTEALDLSAVVRPGTPLASMFTGVLGLQPRMTQIEVFVYLAYAIPMLTYVLWPQKQRPKSVTGAAPQPVATP